MKAVDLFAGFGGLTEGAEQAGIDVLWAANHWQIAVDAHALNHPNATHVCQDLQQANWLELPDYDLLLAAPACQPHSNASQPGRGAKRHDELRQTPIAVIDCVDATEPKYILIENVPQFKKWRLYGWFLDGLRKLGYRLEEHVLTASHFGVPQRRTRLFIVAARDGLKMPNMKFDTRPEPGFGDFIDWNEGVWRHVDEAGPRAQARIARSRERQGVDRFLTQHTRDHYGLTLDQPIRTVTTKDQWAIVDGDRYRPLTVRETARAMGFPEHYDWPSHATRRDCITGFGNAVAPPVAKALATRIAEAA